MAAAFCCNAQHARQLSLLFAGKAASVVAGEIGGGAGRYVGRIAINHVAGLCHPDRFLECAAQENRLCGLRLLRESPDLVFGEIGRFSMTERHIKLAAQVVATNAIEAVAVQVKELRGAIQEITVAAQIEIGAYSVISGLAGVFPEQVARFADQDVRQVFGDVVEVDQIAVDIAQQIAFVVGVEKHRAAADERFNQPFTGWQVLAQRVDYAGLAAQPFQGRAVHMPPPLTLESTIPKPITVIPS